MWVFGFVCIGLWLLVAVGVGLAPASRYAKRAGKPWLYPVGGAVGFVSTMGFMVIFAILARLFGPNLIVGMGMLLSPIAGWIVSTIVIRSIIGRLPQDDVEASYDREGESP